MLLPFPHQPPLPEKKKKEQENPKSETSTQLWGSQWVSSKLLSKFKNQKHAVGAFWCY